MTFVLHLNSIDLIYGLLYSLSVQLYIHQVYSIV